MSDKFPCTDSIHTNLVHFVLYHILVILDSFPCRHSRVPLAFALSSSWRMSIRSNFLTQWLECLRVTSDPLLEFNLWFCVIWRDEFVKSPFDLVRGRCAWCQFSIITYIKVLAKASRSKMKLWERLDNASRKQKLTHFDIQSFIAKYLLIITKNGVRKGRIEYINVLLFFVLEKTGILRGAN